MSSGPEHYREAERLVAESYQNGGTQTDDALFLAEAQVHATLALVAAQIEVGYAISAAGGGSPFPSVEWDRALAPDDAPAVPTSVERADELADRLGIPGGEAAP